MIMMIGIIRSLQSVLLIVSRFIFGSKSLLTKFYIKILILDFSHPDCPGTPLYNVTSNNNRYDLVDIGFNDKISSVWMFTNP